MPSVDNRVVSMQFDNKQFEEKASSTISVLDRLKQSLNFGGAAQGFSDVAAAASRFSLAGIGTAVDEIAGKFTSMGVIAFSVINNVVTKAISAGAQLGKALSLDQMISGFQEYETNMNSIQTVLANTKADGTNLQDVNKALDELNEYSDQTIYNFSEMTRNIGTFTAAGVDLETSTTAIKGIANLAAISGSNSQQASTAMYQLSQALASGSVKLMDWNSVVNAGMGGEVFQKALFETGKTLGTIKDVPIDMTFEEWTAAGNTFRGSLEDGWITADVLTNTLQGFTGDLTDAQLKAMGYNDEQIKQIQEMGATGKDAATKVKTLTQLISTVKESIGSGWSQSFRTVIGDFEEAKALFTEISDAIGKVVGASADQRNELLQGWKDLGGRTKLIEAFRIAITAIASALGTVKNAFRSVFPAATSDQLFRLTEGFKEFAETLQKFVVANRDNIYKIFKGIFSVMSVGVEIIKNVVRVFGSLVKAFTGFGSSGESGVLSFLAGFSDNLINLKKVLVDSGAIEDFFNNISAKINKFAKSLNIGGIFKEAIGFLGMLKDAIVEFFRGGPDENSAVGEAVGVVERRFSALQGLIDKLGNAWDWLLEKLKPVRKAFESVGNAVERAFGDLPQKLADLFANTEYSQVLDTLNTGLFAGLVLLVKKFFSNGILGDAGAGLFASATGALDAFTGKMEAMQTSIKADAILKIAAALAVLTVSIVILSLIDSAALTKSMVAIAAGFGALVGAMTLLNGIITGPGGAAKLALAATGLILLAGAMALLGIAAKTMSTMSWDEISRGLAGVTTMLAAVSGAVKLMSGDTGGMIRAGIGIIGIAIALNILAGAVKLFSMMSYAEISRGMSGIAMGLTAITAAVKLMPDGMVTKGVGLIAVALALNILAGAVKLFSMMSWKELGKGFASIAAGLLIMAGALRLMPNGVSLALQGAGLLMVGVALMVIAKTMKIFASMSWGEIGKGLAGVASILGILALAMWAMSGAIPGAIATAIIAISLGKLAKGIRDFAAISWGDLFKGLLGIAAVLATLALSALAITPVLPNLLALGIVLALIGAGFALFGLGANLVATAFAVIATAGTQGIATLASAIDMLLERLPTAMAALAEGLILMAQQLIDALPGLISGLSEVIQSLLQLVIDNAPKLGETLVVLIQTGLQALRDTVPDIIATGLELLIALLKGIRDNIKEITITVGEIIVEFLQGIADQMDDIIAAGLDVLTEFLKGIADNLSDVVAAAGSVVTEFITAIGDQAEAIVTAGVDALTDFLDGIADAIPDIATSVTDIIVEFVTQIGNKAPQVVDAGFQMFIDLFNGLSSAIRRRSGELGRALGGLASALVAGIGNALKEAIKQVANDLFPGLGNIVSGVLDFFGIHSPSKMFYWIGEQLMLGFQLGIGENMDKPENSLMTGSKKLIGTMQSTMGQLASVLDSNIDMSPTIRPVLDLTNVEQNATRLGDLLDQKSVTMADLSYSQAAVLANTTQTQAEQQQTQQQPSVVNEFKFEQTINSTEPLSIGDIYRETRNQLALAKGALVGA